MNGYFIVNLIERIPGKAPAGACQNPLFANEVMLPYYVASLNIEHAYYEQMKQYEPFPGRCFVDRLDMAEPRQIGLFTPATRSAWSGRKRPLLPSLSARPPRVLRRQPSSDQPGGGHHKSKRAGDTTSKPLPG